MRSPSVFTLPRKVRACCAITLPSTACLRKELIAKIVKAEIPGECKVLDIAAGHGLFGIAVATHNPKAHISAQDWAPVLAVAEENAEKAGVAGRHSKIPGSAFDVDFGSGYNAVLITNFLHHFDRDTNVRLLRKIHQALVPGGRVAVLEFIPDENRVSPPQAAVFSLTMLAVTPAGDAYTFSEHEAMLKEAGFTDVKLHPLPPSPHKVVIAQR